MRIPKRVATAVAVSAAVVSTMAFAPTAQADGNTSLAEVLGVDGVVGNDLDNNWEDYDIVREAADFVLAEIPGTPVAALADADFALTVFAPNDRAFRRLVFTVTGQRLSEPAVFSTLGSLGAATIESVLLYHVVPGTIDSSAALASDGADIATVLGPTIGVRVRSTDPLEVRIADQDPGRVNPALIAGALDINAGNPQIAHGIDRVLRPIVL